MNRMGPEMLERPGRTYPVPDNHYQPEEISQQYHPQAGQNTGFSIPVKEPGTPDAALFFPDIISFLASSDRGIRIAAIASLGMLGDRRAIEPLFRACMDEDDLVKQAAREALATIAMKYR